VLLTEGSKDRPVDVVDAIGVALEQMKLVLCYTREMKHCDLHFVIFRCVLSTKEMFTPVEPTKRIVRSIISGE
jgi:hypothetical protein